MTKYISIRNSGEEDSTIVLFPIPVDGNLTMDDLRSAFSTLVSLRYTDNDNEQQHHVLCRNNTFVEPEEGWDKEGRIFIAVCGSNVNSNSRFGLFESYRNRISSRQKEHRSISNAIPGKRQASTTTTITVGHGHFKSGKFSKISTTSLSCLGGTVVVGPVSITGDTSLEIKERAFEKLCQQNRSIRQKYRSSKQFCLVYPDGTEAKMLPDKSEDFSIIGYRNYLDPHKRFDRLRLYLCDKSNYEQNQSIEIITDSSSDESLPVFSNTTNNVTPISTNNNTLPLTIDVEFHSGDNVYVFAETFPNNAKCSELLDYAAGYMATNKALITMKDIVSNTIIEPTQRLMDLSSSSKFLVCVEFAKTSDNDGEHQTEMENEFIPGNREIDSELPHIIVGKLLQSTHGITEPKTIIKKYQELFCRGRALDIFDESCVIEGDTCPIFVSRSTVFLDGIDELQYSENIRFPLEVNFHGESARDYGGPRKEFFGKMIAEIKQELTDEIDGQIVLKKDERSLALNRYFYAGMVIGLSVIQGGPFADYLASLMDNTDEGEEKTQFFLGLGRTGLDELIKEKTSIKYMFIPRGAAILNVNKFLHLMPAVFSEEGSNRRVKEEASYRKFITYLREVFAGRRENITLSKILKFTTGAEEPLLLGYAIQPSISFVDAAYPTASTCINALQLPYEIQFDRLDIAFCSDYFGLE